MWINKKPETLLQNGEYKAEKKQSRTVIHGRKIFLVGVSLHSFDNGSMVESSPGCGYVGPRVDIKTSSNIQGSKWW